MATIVQKVAGGLGLGRVPGSLRAQLESEGPIRYLAEGILETAVFRHYQAPGFYSWRRRIAFIGYFVLSERRLVARAKCFHSIDINAAYDEPLFGKMTITARRRYLSLAFDASATNAQASGQVEARLHLPDVAAAAAILERVGARVTGPA